MKDFNVVDKHRKIKSYIIMSISFLIMLSLILGVTYIRQNKDEVSSSSSETQSSSTDEISSSSKDEVSSSSIEPITELNQIERFIPNHFNYFNINDEINNLYQVKRNYNIVHTNLCFSDDKLFIDNNGKLVYTYDQKDETENFESCFDEINAAVNIFKNIEEKITSIVVFYGEEVIINNICISTSNKIYRYDFDGVKYLNLIYEEKDLNKKILKLFEILNPDFENCIDISELGIIYEEDTKIYLLNYYEEDNNFYKPILINDYFDNYSIITRSDKSCNYTDSSPSLGINIEGVLLANREDKNFKFIDSITDKEIIVKELFNFYDEWLIISNDNNLYLFYELGYVNFGKYIKFNYKLFRDEDYSLDYFKSLSIELTNGQKFEYIKE